MTSLSICLLCEELRAAVLEVSQRHMETLLRLDAIDHGTGRDAIRDLQRSLEVDRRRLDDATTTDEAHPRIHMEAGQMA